MQAIVETVFDAFYLVFVISIGIRMVKGSKNNRQFQLFGWMAIVLGAGDSFHLVPRALALCTTGLENYTVPLGLGKWITSVTMTVFYVLLYYVWRERYQIKGKNSLTIATYALAIIRIALCMMPQNDWLSANAPLSWGIYRNIPFAVLGLLMIVLFYKSAKEECKRKQRYFFSMDVVNYRIKLWILYSCSIMGRCNSYDWYVNDSKNMCVCMDCSHWLQRNEKRSAVSVFQVFFPKDTFLFCFFSLLNT